MKIILDNNDISHAIANFVSQKYGGIKFNVSLQAKINILKKGSDLSANDIKHEFFAEVETVE